MPSAANAKSEKPASSEATDNSPVRQIMTVIEHKIRNLEKRKSKLTSYRDLQKAGKDLNSDQKVAVAKYDEVAQTLEFARDLAKQIASIATSAEREAKKQAKRDAWVRYAAETAKIREVLLILDCLVQMGNSEARDDFLNGANGACKLTEEDLKILDDLYPEVTPKHELNEEGQPGFHIHTSKAAEHLYAIIDGKPKEVLGTTYTHIKEIVSSVHGCGYFDKGAEPAAAEEQPAPAPGEEPPALEEEAPPPAPHATHAPPPAPHAPPTGPEPDLEPEVAAVFVGVPAGPAPGLAAPYPLRALPPITLQEVEHAYFAHQYPQQRPIAEVIGSQNFFFLQESEIDSPVGTPQPPQIPTQTFTNQHFVLSTPAPDPSTLPLPPQFPPPPHHEHVPAPFPAVPILPVQSVPHPTISAPVSASVPVSSPQPTEQPNENPTQSPPHNKEDDEWKEPSPERTEQTDRKTQGQGDGQNRFRRYGGRGRGTSNGFRGRGAFQGRQGNDYHGGYQGRANNKDYQSRQYGDNRDNYRENRKDNYQREGRERGNDNYYGNGDAAEGENGRERYGDGQGYAGGFKSRGRGAPRGARRPSAPRARPDRPDRPDRTDRQDRPDHYSRKPDPAE